MDSSVHEQGSDRQQDPKRSWVRLLVPLSILKWLAELINLTEEEQQDAGIYLDRKYDE
jgi:hypothetical protein